MEAFVIVTTELEQALIQSVMLEYQQSSEASVSPENFNLVSSLRVKFAGAEDTHFLSEDELDLVESVMNEFNQSHEGHASWQTEKLVASVLYKLSQAKQQQIG